MAMRAVTPGLGPLQAPMMKVSSTARPTQARTPSGVRNQAAQSITTVLT